MQDGVAVGIGSRDKLGADAAAGAAAAVLHDDALTEDGAEPIGNDARHAVGRPARRERHDEFDRAIGIVLGLREIGAEQRAADVQRYRQQNSNQPGLPSFSAMRLAILPEIARRLQRGVLTFIEMLAHCSKHRAEHLRRQHAGVGVVARAVIAAEQGKRTDRALPPWLKAAAERLAPSALTDVS